jgi:hypothetical protein
MTVLSRRIFIETWYYNVIVRIIHNSVRTGSLIIQISGGAAFDEIVVMADVSLIEGRVTPLQS